MLHICNEGYDHTYRRDLFVSWNTQGYDDIQGNKSVLWVIFNVYKSVMDMLHHVQESSKDNYLSYLLPS